jgi:hypothetical protein
MLDLTGANLAAYLIRVVKDAVIRNPRFRQTLGDVAVASNNQVLFGDVQVIVKSISSSGNRLSPDNFMLTQHGRALIAKVKDKEGCFVEWCVETDREGSTLDPGIYYLSVTSVDEGTRAVGLDIHKYQWREGNITNAQGSQVVLRAGLDGTLVVPYDIISITNVALTSNLATITAVNVFQPGDVVTITGLTTSALNGTWTVTAASNTTFTFALTHANISSTADSGLATKALIYNSNYSFLYLFTPAQNLTLVYNSGNLIPLVDYWFIRTQSQVLIASTAGGYEDADIPVGYNNFSITDQNDYVLRPNLDYYQPSANVVRFGEWTPAGSTLTITGDVIVDPSSNSSISPENILNITLGVGQTIVPDQVFISSSYGDFTNVVPLPNGSVTIPRLLGVGEYLHWEARIDCGTTSVVGKKLELNPLVTGLWVAIGDQVVVGDQVAIIISPFRTETYEVYGSKDNVNISLDIKANDLTTASEISELIKQQLLIFKRENMEADGITIFEVSRDYTGEARDASGTAPRFVYNLNIQAMCDWKVFMPLVTRLVSFQITDSAVVPGYLETTPRAQAFGAFRFIPSYT